MLVWQEFFSALYIVKKRIHKVPENVVDNPENTEDFQCRFYSCKKVTITMTDSFELLAIRPPHLEYHTFEYL